MATMHCVKLKKLDIKQEKNHDIVETNSSKD